MTEFNHSFLNPYDAEPKIRHATLSVSYADGTSMLFVIRDHFQLKTGDAHDFADREIRSFYGALTPEQTSPRRIILDNIDSSKIEQTMFLGKEAAEKLQDDINAAKQKLLVERITKPEPPQPPKFPVGTLIRQPAEHNPPGTPHRKFPSIWKIVDVEFKRPTLNISGFWWYKVEDRNGVEWPGRIAENSIIGSSWERVDDWPLRRGDFVTSSKYEDEPVRKVLGPVKAEGWTAGVDLSRNPWWTEYDDGSRGWDYEEDLRRIEVAVIKTWQAFS